MQQLWKNESLLQSDRTYCNCNNLTFNFQMIQFFHFTNAHFHLNTNQSRRPRTDRLTDL